MPYFYVNERAKDRARNEILQRKKVNVFDAGPTIYFRRLQFYNIFSQI